MIPQTETMAAISEEAQEECLRVLSVMGPFSVSKLLEALEAGKVDGRDYGKSNNTVGLPENWDYNWSVDCNEPEYPEWTLVKGEYVLGERVKEENFVGCLLGWAGFMEHVAMNDIRKRIQKQFGTITAYRDDTTYYIEKFLAHIQEGDTPENDRYAARFKQIIVDFQAGKLKPHHQKERVY